MGLPVVVIWALNQTPSEGVELGLLLDLVPLAVCCIVGFFLSGPRLRQHVKGLTSTVSNTTPDKIYCTQVKPLQVGASAPDCESPKLPLPTVCVAVTQGLPRSTMGSDRDRHRANGTDSRSSSKERLLSSMDNQSSISTAVGTSRTTSKDCNQESPEVDNQSSVSTAIGNTYVGSKDSDQEPHDVGNAAVEFWSELPEVYEADVPSSAYLKRTEEILQAVVEEIRDPSNDVETKKLRKSLTKVGLEHESGGHICTDEEGAVVEELAKAVRREKDGQGKKQLEVLSKELHQMLMRYPCSPELTALLDQHGFQWHNRPLRGIDLDRAGLRWMDRTASAADSSFFSALGIWTSPYAIPYFGFAVFASWVMLAFFIMMNPNFFKSFSLMFLWYMSSLVLQTATLVQLWRGRRLQAQRLYALMGTIFGLYTFADCILLLGKWGPYSKEHVPPMAFEFDVKVTSYPWQVVLAHFLNGIGHAVMQVGLGLYPNWTFHWIVSLHGTGHWLVALLLLPVTEGMDRPWIKSYLTGQTWGAAATWGIGTFLWFRRKYALEDAKVLMDKEFVKYHEQWQSMLKWPGFKQSLALQEAAWNRIMAKALHVPRRQLSAKSLGDLFQQADRLNDRYQRKMFEICQRHGGSLFFCEVKQHSRTLQKMYRAYKGDWRQLCDLVRTSMVFTELPSLTACMEDLAADPELKLVAVCQDKMRLSEVYDSRLSGGYRDVQLTVMLDNAATRSLGCHEHRAELQLHIRDVIALKTEGGHATYVQCRNLRGQ